jgi:hypothetical protein
MYALDFKPGIDVTQTIEYLESLKAQEAADLYKGMSRTFFSLRRRRGFISRHPAPPTMEDACLVSCPWVIPSQQLHLL